MPPYTQFGLLCATKAEVLSVKIDANNRLRRERGGESHKRGEGRKGERVKHKERRRLKEKTERVL